MDLTSIQSSPLLCNVITGSYDTKLVILSYVIAVMASYVALDISSLLRTVPLKSQYSINIWQWIGAFAMGAGIWSMHFIGMLAYKMPMPMFYDLKWTLVSMLVAVLASGFAFYLLIHKEINLLKLALGGVVLGLGIVSMHYLGMAGMLDVKIRYIPSLFLLSILIAIVASEFALWLAIQGSKKNYTRQYSIKIISALIMGAAIAGMHYTGMAAAIFTPLPPTPHLDFGLDTNNLALIIAFVTAIIIGIALFASTTKQLISNKVYQKNRQLIETQNKLENLKSQLEVIVAQQTKDLQSTISILKGTFDAINDAIIVLDLEDNIVEYNKRYLEFWKVPESLVKNQKFSKLLEFLKNQMSDSILFEIRIKEMLKNKNDESYIEWKLKDRRVIGRYTIPRKIDNKIMGQVIGIRDITAVKRAQERLTFQYDIIQLISELNSLENTFTTILKKLCKTFDFEVGLFWKRNFEKNHLECYLDWHHSGEALDQLVARKNEMRFLIGQSLAGEVWKSQQVKWVYDINQNKNFPLIADLNAANLVCAVGIPIFVNGDIYGVFELLSKINYPQDEDLLNLFKTLSNQLEIFIQRKQNEDRLRLVTRAIEANKDGMLIVNVKELTQPIVYVNPAFEKITGYKEEESLGKNCRFLQGNDHDQPELSHIKLAQLECREGIAVIRNYKKNGQLFWNELHIAPVVNEEGNVDYFVGTIRDVTKRKKMEDQLLYQATYDSLTNLPNRILLKDRLSQAILYASRDNNLFAVIYIDLDNFKFVNDSFGHKSGDNLLKQVAKRIMAAIKESDTVSRLGGDEFAIIIININDTHSAFIKKLFDVFKDPFIIEGKPLKITASMGVSIYPKDGLDIEELIKKADIAMYHAKKEGRNQFYIFNDDLTIDFQKKHRLEYSLQFALEKNQFHLFYQPLINLKTRKIIGVEALIRWHHPELGWIPPLEFINLAEELGLIISIGTWVLKTACQQNWAWQQLGLPPIKMAVNLSMIQFKEENFVEKIKSILDKTGLKPEYLEMEITESMLMENSEQVIDKLIFLRELGVNLAIDDFGTGYSSLSYLKKLPVNKLKIDKSFVQDIFDNENTKAIVLAIISMAKILNLKILAEGIEKKEEALFFNEQHCDEAQGYYYSKPLDTETCTEFLKNYITGRED